MTAPAEFACPCGHSLGQSTPSELRAGGLVLRHATTCYCPECGRRNYWRPLARAAAVARRRTPRRPPEN